MRNRRQGGRSAGIEGRRFRLEGWVVGRERCKRIQCG